MWYVYYGTRLFGVFGSREAAEEEAEAIELAYGFRPYVKEG